MYINSKANNLIQTLGLLLIDLHSMSERKNSKMYSPVMVGSCWVRSHWACKIHSLVTYFVLWQESISYFCKVIISSRTAECVISGLQVNILRLISKLSVFMLPFLLLLIARCLQPLLNKLRMMMCRRLWDIIIMENNSTLGS